MEISIGSLMEYLEEYKPSTASDTKRILSFHEVRRWESTNPACDKDILYIARASELLEQPAEGKMSNVLCIDDGCGLDEVRLLDPTTGMIVLGVAESVDGVLKSIEGIIEDHHYLDFCGRELLQALLAEKDVHQLINMGYTLLGNPICLFDNNFTYIAYSQAAHLNNSFWRDMEAKGAIADENLALLRKERLFHNDVTHKSAFICEKGIFGYERIVDHVRINGKNVATMVVWGSEKQFKRIDIAISAMLCCSVSMIVKRSFSLHHSNVLAFEYFIKDLLDGRIKDSEAVTDTETEFLTKIAKIFIS